MIVGYRNIPEIDLKFLKPVPDEPKRESQEVPSPPTTEGSILSNE